MSLVSEKDFKRIEEAIARVESQSATEVVVAVVARSADYWQPRVALAGAWSVGLAFAVVSLWHSVHPLWVIAAQIPVALAVYAVTSYSRLLRWLVPAPVAQSAVEARAFRMFAERGVHSTRERTGLLLLISELEHRVVILGDSGIDQRVHHEGWQSHVDHLVQRIREGRTTDGILEVIDALRAPLAELVPIQPDDTNELPNQVIRE
jgi:putative membrane protein